LKVFLTGAVAFERAEDFAPVGGEVESGDRDDIAGRPRQRAAAEKGADAWLCCNGSF
jgi:hypothetical protein